MGDPLWDLRIIRSQRNSKYVETPQKMGIWFCCPRFSAVDVAELHLPGTQDAEERMKLKRTRLAPGSSESTVIIARPHH